MVRRKRNGTIFQRKRETRKELYRWSLWDTKAAIQWTRKKHEDVYPDETPGINRSKGKLKNKKKRVH